MSELKENDWYFITDPLEGSNYVGIMGKILKITDNPNYYKVEQWIVTKDRKFEEMGTINEVDGVFINKFGKKIPAPPKAFQLLRSKTVNQILDIDQTIDTQIESNEE